MEKELLFVLFSHRISFLTRERANLYIWLEPMFNFRLARFTLVTYFFFLLGVQFFSSFALCARRHYSVLFRPATFPIFFSRAKAIPSISGRAYKYFNRFGKKKWDFSTFLPGWAFRKFSRCRGISIVLELGDHQLSHGKQNRNNSSSISFPTARQTKQNRSELPSLARVGARGKHNRATVL